MHPFDDNEAGKLKQELKDTKILLKDYKGRFEKADMEAYRLRGEVADLKRQIEEEKKKKTNSKWKLWPF